MLRYRAISYFLLFGIIFTILSIPFITGIMTLSYASRNPYALFYSIFVWPVQMTCQDLITSVAGALWDSPTPGQTANVEFLFSAAFWAIVGSVVGYIQDFRENR